MNKYLFILASSIVVGILIFSFRKKLNLNEDWIMKVLIYSFVGVSICTILMFFDLRIKGRYTTSLIGIVFIISSFVLFSITKTRKRRVLSGIVTIPLTALGILSLVHEGWLIVLLIPYLIFQAPLAKSEINKSHNAEIRYGGFFACGESIYVTKTFFGLLDKQVHVGNNHCVKGIYEIETITFNDKKYEFLIHHTDSDETESPYNYLVELDKED